MPLLLLLAPQPSVTALSGWRVLEAYSTNNGAYGGTVNTTFFASNIPTGGGSPVASFNLKAISPNWFHALATYLGNWPDDVNGNGKLLSNLGGLTLGSGAVMTAPGQPRCLAYNHAGASIPTNAWITISLDSETFSIGGMHSTTVNPSRLTAQTTGLYLVGGVIGFSPNATGQRIVRIRQNADDTKVLCYANELTVISSGQTTVVPLVPMLAQLVAGDFVEIQGYQDSGSTLTTFVDFTLAWILKQF